MRWNEELLQSIRYTHWHQRLFQVFIKLDGIQELELVFSLVHAKLEPMITGKWIHSKVLSSNSVINAKKSKKMDKSQYPLQHMDEQMIPQGNKHSE